MMRRLNVVMTWVRHAYSVFFFSSRRRHTRYWRDWSSDVCSSDLAERIVAPAALANVRRELALLVSLLQPIQSHESFTAWKAALSRVKIGRASCRERV